MTGIFCPDDLDNSPPVVQELDVARNMARAPKSKIHMVDKTNALNRAPIENFTSFIV